MHHQFAIINLRTDESVHNVIRQASYLRLSWEILSCLLVLDIPESRVELQTD